MFSNRILIEGQKYAIAKPKPFKAFYRLIEFIYKTAAIQYFHFSSISGTIKEKFRCRFVLSTSEYSTRLFNTCSMCCFIGFNRQPYSLNAAVAFAVTCVALALSTNSRNYLFDKASGFSLLLPYYIRPIMKSSGLQNEYFRLCLCIGLCHSEHQNH